MIILRHGLILPNLSTDTKQESYGMIIYKDTNDRTVHSNTIPYGGTRLTATRLAREVLPRFTDSFLQSSSLRLPSRTSHLAPPTSCRHFHSSPNQPSVSARGSLPFDNFLPVVHLLVPRNCAEAHPLHGQCKCEIISYDSFDFSAVPTYQQLSLNSFYDIQQPHYIVLTPRARAFANFFLSVSSDIACGERDALRWI